MKARNALFGIIMLLFGTAIGMDIVAILHVPDLPSTGADWLIMELLIAAVYGTIYVSTS